MAKLFSMEDDVVTPEGAEGEGQDEAAEVAAVETELAEDGAGEVEEMGEAVDNGIEAAGELEQVEAVVEKAEEEEGGLTPVGAEAVRIALEAIARKVDYPVERRIYTLYAAESFDATSSRRANTQLALEGIRDFLVDLWERIKAAVKKMWDKIVAFWDKHVSTVGRLVKATKSMDKKIQDASTKAPKEDFKDEKPCPASLANLFQFGSTLTSKEVKDALAAGSANYVASIDSSFLIKLNSAFLSDATKLLKETNTKDPNEIASSQSKDNFVKLFSLGSLVSAAGNLLNGIKATEGKKIKLQVPNSNTPNNEEIASTILEIDRDEQAEKPEDIVPGNIGELKVINNRAMIIAQEALKMTDVIRKAKEAHEKLQKDIDNVVRKMDKKSEVKKSDLKDEQKINERHETAQFSAYSKRSMMVYSSTSRSMIQLFSVVQSEYIKCVKGSLMFCSFSLRQYR